MVKHLPFGHEGQARPEKSLVWVLIFVKTSLCGNKALVAVGLSLTAASLVKMTRRNVFCFYVWRVVSCQLIELCCELEQQATEGLSGNVYNVELF